MKLANDPIWQDPRPWLVAGTGPSLDGWNADDREAFRVMAIHKAALVTDPDVVVAMDWNPLKAVLAKMTPRRAIVEVDIQRIYYPRFGLAEALDKHLQELYDSDLYVFRTHNHTDSDVEAGPGIQIRHCTGEAAFDILGHLGVKEVYSIGIDGGPKHAQAMNEPVAPNDPYAPQEQNLLDIVKRHGMTWNRLCPAETPSSL